MKILRRSVVPVRVDIIVFTSVASTGNIRESFFLARYIQIYSNRFILYEWPPGVMLLNNAVVCTATTTI